MIRVWSGCRASEDRAYWLKGLRFRVLDVGAGLRVQRLRGSAWC